MSLCLLLFTVASDCGLRRNLEVHDLKYNLHKHPPRCTDYALSNYVSAKKNK